MRFYAGSSILILEEMGEAGHFEIHVDCHVDDEAWECLKELTRRTGWELSLSTTCCNLCSFELERWPLTVAKSGKVGIG